MLNRVEVRHKEWQSVMIRGETTTPQLDPKQRFDLQDVREEIDGSPRVNQAIVELARAVTSTQVAQVLLRAGVTAVGATSGAIVLLTEDRRDLRVVHAVGRMAETLQGERRFPLTSDFPLVEVVRSRDELWISSPEELTLRHPELVPEVDACGWAFLPLLVDSVVLGAVGWGFRERGLRHRRCFTVKEKSCLRRLVHAGGGAIYRAGLYDAERRLRADAEIARHKLSLVRESAAAKRDELMTEVSVTLDSTADTGVALARIGRLCLPLLGDWCAIDVLDDRGKLTRCVAAHVDASTDKRLRRRYARPENQGHRLLRGMRDGKPVIVSSLADGLTGGTGLGVHEIRLLRQVGLNQLMVVPVRIRGHTLGTISLAANDARRRYNESDIALAQRIGRHCAAAIECSRLYTTALQATQTRDDLVAATSHELRTPLSHIKGFVSTLRTTDTVWEPEIRDDFLAEIEREADRLARLVENLLDMSRIDSGGLDPAARTATPPAALVEGGVGRMRGSLGDHPIDIQLAEELPSVWVDASQMERVIANLLDNAAKYSAPGQPIGVVGRLTGDAVSLRIEDHGLGIPPEHMERIFEPFFREPTAGYPAKPGTGLGLAICRSIIRAHGGHIWAELRPGGGAAFVFTLPRATGSRKG
jgi:signal transduction histidine kinase